MDALPFIVSPFALRALQAANGSETWSCCATEVVLVLAPLLAGSAANI